MTDPKSNLYTETFNFMPLYSHLSSFSTSQSNLFSSYSNNNTFAIQSETSSSYAPPSPPLREALPLINNISLRKQKEKNEPSKSGGGMVEEEERVSSWSYDREIISFNKGNKTYKEAIDHMHIQEGEMF